MPPLRFTDAMPPRNHFMASGKRNSERTPSKRAPARTARLPFADRVRAIVRAIPPGSTLSYGEVAGRAGNPRAARAVGAIMRANHDPAIPCHRVIRATGEPGGYNRGALLKKAILDEEFARAHASPAGKAGSR
jgi:O-6-methylguanine DNA methyltransferase